MCRPRAAARVVGRHYRRHIARVAAVPGLPGQRHERRIGSVDAERLSHDGAHRTVVRRSLVQYESSGWRKDAFSLVGTRR